MARRSHRTMKDDPAYGRYVWRNAVFLAAVQCDGCGAFQIRGITLSHCWDTSSQKLAKGIETASEAHRQHLYQIFRPDLTKPPCGWCVGTYRAYVPENMPEQVLRSGLRQVGADPHMLAQITDRRILNALAWNPGGWSSRKAVKRHVRWHNPEKES